ncbi:MAG: DegV family protein [Sedimentibacter sp.]|uniref:DegV family protein n=1 Tax=Sedimentibacter sp. TaxID=1960295 RepID=UPI0031594838
MSEYIVTCCSTADMPLEFFKARNVPFVCFHFIMDGMEYEDDLGQSMAFDEFYKRISDGAQPTTSQVNVGQFNDLFEGFLKEGKDILHISLSSGLSGTYGSACAARDVLLEKYPDRKILVVDSLAASSGYGLLVDAACDLRDSGLNIEQVYDYLQENKLYDHHWFFSTDLTSYYRGGRISAAANLFGTMLNICPLLNVNQEGRLIPREKIRGKKKVIEEIVKKMELNAKDGLDYSGKCFISNSSCYEDARKVADLVESRFPKLDGKVMINSIGTVIGSHTGPGTVALFFFGNKRTD